MHTTNKKINKEISKTIEISKISNFTLTEINEILKTNLEVIDHKNHKEIIVKVIQKMQNDGYIVYTDGVLDVCGDLRSNDYGFIRRLETNFSNSLCDVYINLNVIKFRKLHLKSGLYIKGIVQKNGDKLSILDIITINNIPIKQYKPVKPFEKLKPTYPRNQINLELDTSIIKNSKLTEDQLPKRDELKLMRLIDLFSPIGYGTRSLIVAPPKGGKTSTLISIAKSVLFQYKDIFLIILLIDERAEENSEIREQVSHSDNVLVISSTFDEPHSRHMHVTKLGIEIAKRKAEMGKNVFILLDSLTRLIRASNASTPSSGKVLSGGIDVSAFYEPKKIFASARCLKEGGSITMCTTVLIDTKHKMDCVILEELKGSGNCDIICSVALSKMQLFPTYDVIQSSTRNSNLLLGKVTNDKINKFRRLVNNGNEIEVYNVLNSQMKTFKTNKELIESSLFKGE